MDRLRRRMLRHGQVQALAMPVEVVALLHLLRRLSGLLLELPLLCFLRFLLLAGRCVRLRELVRRGFFVPTPFLFEVFVDEADFPAGLLVDLVEDLENFFLLVALG